MGLDKSLEEKTINFIQGYNTYIQGEGSEVVGILLHALLIWDDRYIISIVKDNSSTSIIIISLAPPSYGGELASKVLILQSKGETGKGDGIWYVMKRVLAYYCFRFLIRYIVLNSLEIERLCIGFKKSN